MDILYSEGRVRTDVYTYELNQGGGLGLTIRADGDAGIAYSKHVSITFVNGKFSAATFPFDEPYTRSHWYYLKAIAERIEELERLYKDQTKVQVSMGWTGHV